MQITLRLKDELGVCECRLSKSSARLWIGARDLWQRSVDLIYQSDDSPSSLLAPVSVTPWTFYEPAGARCTRETTYCSYAEI